jgi:integrase
MTVKPRISASEVARGAHKRTRTRQSPITQPGYRRGEKPANAGRVFPPEPLTTEEALRLIDQCGGGKVGDRNRALIILMWRTGLRVHEALLLRPHHVDFDNGTVTVLRGKGGKRRTSGIDPWALEQLQQWADRRATLNIPVGSPFICAVMRGSEGNPVHPAFARALLTRLGRQAGIEKRCHPHGLRHTHACDLVREGVSVHLIQRQLGHSDLGMTARYLAGIAPEEVVQAMQLRPAPGQAAPSATQVSGVRRDLEHEIANDAEEAQTDA